MMRSMWMATSVIVVVLAFAATLQPRERASDSIAGSDDAAASQSSAADPPRPLAAEDLDRIMELRAQIGSAANWIGSEKIATSGFERELRQLAGLGQAPAPDAATTADHQDPIAAEIPSGGEAARAAVLTQAAIALDEAANQAEGNGELERAGYLRDLSGKLRRVARHPHLVPAAEDVGDGLIDKSQAPQAQ